MTNKQRVNNLIANLQKQGVDIGIDSNSNGLKICNKKESWDFSPRLPPKLALLWLEGYIMGRDSQIVPRALQLPGN